jgi:DNA-binding GntR family transcriptional regulator
MAPLLERDLTQSLYGLMVSVGARVEHARDTIEAVAATGKDARLLKVAAGAPLVFIQGVAFSGAMEPLRYSEALYRADRFRFAVDTTHPDGLMSMHKLETAPVHLMKGGS